MSVLDQKIVDEIYAQSVKLPSLGKLYPQNHMLYEIDSVEITPITTLGEDILTSKNYSYVFKLA
jgi:hypothetical protein